MDETRRNPTPERRKLPRLRSPLVIVAAVVVSVPILLAHTAGPAAAARSHSTTTSVPDTVTTSAPNTTSTPVPDISSRCPWLESAIDRGETPTQLARTVLARMTVAEKLGEVVLVQLQGVRERQHRGSPALHPVPHRPGRPPGVGLSAPSTSPSSRPPWASPPPSTLRSPVPTARSQGSEAAGQGVDVVQGPTLNIDRVPRAAAPTRDSARTRSWSRPWESPTSRASSDRVHGHGQGVRRLQPGDRPGRAQRRRSPSGPSRSSTFRPFKAAVTQAHVSTVMCAYPQLNGTFQCQDGLSCSPCSNSGGSTASSDPTSDRCTIRSPPSTAGTDLIKPAQVDRAGAAGRPAPDCRVARSMRAVTQVLTADVRPWAGDPLRRRIPGDRWSTPPPHRPSPSRTAERSAVLLKDQGRILPLVASAAPSRVAVIGADASSATVTTGFGSSWVHRPLHVHPAVRHPATGRAPAHGHLQRTAEAPPSTSRRSPSQLPDPDLGCGPWAHADPDPDRAGRRCQSGAERRTHRQRHHAAPHLDRQPLPGLTRSPSVEHRRPPLPSDRLGSLGIRGLPPPPAPRWCCRPGGRTSPPPGPGPSHLPSSGLYTLSLQGDGQAKLSLDGKPASPITLDHALGRWAQTVSLMAGHPYRVRLDWTPFDTTTPVG